MPLKKVIPRGAADVLADSKGILRFEEIQEEANAPELVLRREIDKLVLSGQVERFPVGDHIMVKTTEEFEGGSEFTADIVDGVVKRVG